MTRTRKLTLSMKEFSHLVSESLDISSAPLPQQSLVEHTAVFSETSQKPRSRASSFQRIFSRPTPAHGQREDSTHGTPEDLSDSPRKMVNWPFSRSPRKNRPTQDGQNAINEMNDPATYHSPYAIASPAAASTSSLGSLVPDHERLFRDLDEPGLHCHLFRGASSSPSAVALPSACAPPTGSGHCAAAISSHTISGNESAPANSHRSRVETNSDISNQTRTSLEGTESSHSVANCEPEGLHEDPTPRASSFGPQMALPPTEVRDGSFPAQRGRTRRLSLVVPLRDANVLALRPAIGVAPHVPSETDSSVCIPSPTSSVARGSSPTFPTMGSPGSETSLLRVPPSTPPNLRSSAVFPDIVSLSNAEFAPPLSFSARQRKRAMSRSMTPPPLPRPPPTGPLPAVPSPVPPLPPLLNKISMNLTPHPIISSPSRSTITGVPMNPTTGLPPSPPGGLRLPSRLSWVNGVRAVLPSPPASPTKSLKSLTGKMPHPVSPSKAEKRRPNDLKRPLSIGVIEAADSAQVRRTKSILLLGSRSKSNASLGTKRVQIHTDLHSDITPSCKPRRKSSAVTIAHPIFPSDCPAVITPMASSELLVPRERRHSAPMMSSLGRDVLDVSADWTLSLPFFTDIPGNKISPSPLPTPELKSEHSLEQIQGEDWTLCMPLKVRPSTPTTERRDSECTPAETSELVQMQSTMQLPTPSPSPTWPTPSSVHPLDPEERIPKPEGRPASPTSLGPHVGGLDLAGGRGKRASGWHVYGWFDEVSVQADERDAVAPSTAAAISDNKPVKNHITAFRRAQDASGRHPSQDSTSTVSTSDTTFYSARSSILVS